MYYLSMNTDTGLENNGKNAPARRYSCAAAGREGNRAMAKTRRHCHRCKQTKTETVFILDTQDRHYGLCRACVRQIEAIRASGAKPVHTSTRRTCYLCRRLKPVGAFTRRSNGSYFSACRDCNIFVLSARRRAALKAQRVEQEIQECREAILLHKNQPS